MTRYKDIFTSKRNATTFDVRPTLRGPDLRVALAPLCPAADEEPGHRPPVSVPRCYGAVRLITGHCSALCYPLGSPGKLYAPRVGAMQPVQPTQPAFAIAAHLPTQCMLVQCMRQ